MNLKNIKKLALTTIAFTCLSCSHTKTQPMAPASPGVASVVPGPVIIKIASRDTTIVARSGNAGPVYSVESKTGEVLIPSMPLEEMVALHPEIGNKVKVMQASAWVGVDAAR